MPWPKTGATQYHAKLGLPDKGGTIKGLFVSVCYDWDLEPLDLLNGLALGCYQLSPKVLPVYAICIVFQHSYTYITQPDCNKLLALHNKSLVLLNTLDIC